MSKERNGKTQKLVIEYKESPDYRIIPANGAWGGLSPKGDIVMNLYFEHAKTPLSVTHDVEQGKMGPESDRDTGGAAFTRQLQVGVVMNPGVAESVAKWLLGKVEDLNKQLGKGRPL